MTVKNVIGGILMAGAFAYAGAALVHISGKDTLGRQLVESPAAARAVFWVPHQWPGARWYLFDVALFFGLIGAATYLFRRDGLD